MAYLIIIVSLPDAVEIPSSLWVRDGHLVRFVDVGEIGRAVAIWLGLR
jgi:hypothetical protein